MLSTFIMLAAMQAGSIMIQAPQAAPVLTTVPAPVSAPPAVSVQLLPVQAEPLSLPEPQTAPPAREDNTPAEAEAPPVQSDLALPEPDARASEIVAPQPVPKTLSPTERRAVLKAAGEALSAVETARGRFVQVDAAGQLSEGRFALQRPGRMRFDYDDPTPILVAADGVTVAIVDEELETIDRVPLAATPLNLLLDDKLDFETEAEVTDVRRANGLLAVTLRDRNEEADGTLTLIFDAASYQLISWRAEDSNGGLTTVRLSGVETGMRLNPRLFIVEDAETEDRRRR